MESRRKLTFISYAYAIGTIFVALGHSTPTGTSDLLLFIDKIRTFTIYILSWSCQAVLEILFKRVLHLHWFITMPAMFCAGLFIPLLIICIYRKLKYNPKFINLVIGLN